MQLIFPTSKEKYLLQSPKTSFPNTLEILVDLFKKGVAERNIFTSNIDLKNFRAIFLNHGILKVHHFGCNRTLLSQKFALSKICKETSRSRFNLCTPNIETCFLMFRILSLASLLKVIFLRGYRLDCGYVVLIQNTAPYFLESVK